MSCTCNVVVRSGLLFGILVGTVLSPTNLAIGEDAVIPAPDEKAQQEIKKAAEELPAPPTEIQEALLKLHNQARVRSGLSPLKPHPRLMAAAQRYAEFMHRTGHFSHFGDGRSPADRIRAEGYRHGSWAENIAWSQSTPESAMNTWMNSGGHRGNILSGHQQVGFGKVGTIWVAVFANPVASPVQISGVQK